MSLEPDAVVRVLLRGRLRLAAIAMAIVRDPHAADDVFQQVVLSALEHLTHFHDSNHVLAWALRAARFRAIDLARERRVRVLSDTILDRLEDRWRELPDSELTEEVRVLYDCLDQLAPHARELLRLRYDQGLSVVAIAARLQRNADAVYQSLSRIHRALRGCVRQKLDGEPAPAVRETQR